MTMITPSYLGETIEYSSLHACRSTLEDPTAVRLACRHALGLEPGHPPSSGEPDPATRPRGPAAEAGGDT